MMVKLLFAECIRMSSISRGDTSWASSTTTCSNRSLSKPLMSVVEIEGRGQIGHARAPGRLRAGRCGLFLWLQLSPRLPFLAHSMILAESDTRFMYSVLKSTRRPEG